MGYLLSYQGLIRVCSICRMFSFYRKVAKIHQNLCSQISFFVDKLMRNFLHVLTCNYLLNAKKYMQSAVVVGYT